jgi:ComF family protein
MEPIASDLCLRCGDAPDRSRSSSGASPLCRACRLVPPAFDRAVAYGLYAGRLKQAIHALKYDGFRPAARPLAQKLAAAIDALRLEMPVDLLVVPVPLHRVKLAQRGFNQARILAQHAIDALGATHPDWKLTLAAESLIRQRATETQAGLTPRQRRQNLRGAFVVYDADAVAGRHILLIDDILTTGATARAAAQTLRKADAASVRVATLARAIRFDNVRPAYVLDNAGESCENDVAGSSAENSYQGESLF